MVGLILLYAGIATVVVFAVDGGDDWGCLYGPAAIALGLAILSIAYS